MPQPIAFRTLTEADLPMLAEWHARPHVAEWWQPVPSLAALQEEHRPFLVPEGLKPLDAPQGMVIYLALEAGEPVAYVQAYRVMVSQDEGWWVDERDPYALGVDQFIGPADRLGQGLGSRMLRAFLAFLFEDPRVTSVQTDPQPNNPRAIKAYRKAGFLDVGLVHTPDGEALLMRAERGPWLARAIPGAEPCPEKA